MKKKNFTKIAKDVIELEIKSLQKLKKKIDNSFNKAVIEIAKCQSKVIVCGVGKSGLIASKIAATLSSVGTPSFNLSASDSSHGDLGSIQKKDVLILLSYSGQTIPAPSGRPRSGPTQPSVRTRRRKLADPSASRLWRWGAAYCGP